MNLGEYSRISDLSDTFVNARRRSKTFGLSGVRLKRAFTRVTVFQRR